MAAPLCLFWTISKERNKIVFENVVFSLHKLKSLVYIPLEPRLA